MLDDKALVETGIVPCDIDICIAYELKGICTGNVIVKKGGVFHLQGVVSGSVILEKGSQAVINGRVDGDLINEGGDFTLTGGVVGKVFRRCCT